MKTGNKDRLALIASMLVFGTIGLVRRYIPFPSSVVAMLRGVLGVLVLLAVHFIRKERFSGDVLKKNLLPLIVSGIVMGFNWVALFEAYRYTTVSVATICYYMAPVFMILFSPIVLKERLTKEKALCTAVAFLGMVLVSGVLEEGLSGLRGVLYGLAAAIMYAFVILTNKFIKGVPARERTLVQLAAAAIAVLPYVLLTEDLTALTWTPLGTAMMLVAGIVHTGFTYVLYFGSIERIPTQTVALFSYIDPVFAVFLSVTVLRERISALTAVGCVLVLGATLFSERK